MAAYDDVMKDDDSTPVTTQPGLNGEPVMTSEETGPSEESKESTVESSASNSTASTAIPMPPP